MKASLGRAAGAIPGLCGMAATLTGVGIARFAYVAILPVLVQQGWFGREAAGHLGAANLTGYLLGIGLAALLAGRFPPGWLVRWSMLLCALSLFACAWRGGGMPWFLFWRVVAGACGAVLMVQAPVLILPRVAAWASSPPPPWCPALRSTAWCRPGSAWAASARCSPSRPGTTGGSRRR
jgi:hypothetical protein